MSARNRAGGRPLALETYATPPWVTRLLLDNVALPGGRWLEPCAGDGDLIRAVEREDVRWDVCELRPGCGPTLEKIPAVLNVGIGDCRPGLAAIVETSAGHTLDRPPYDVVITNPPYSLAGDIIGLSMPIALYTVMLLRLNYLGSGKRNSFMRRFAPDVYVIPDRPSFYKGAKASVDATEYGWFVWQGLLERSRGYVSVLPSLPAEARRVTK